jgi:hypothetical protein
VNVIEIFLNFVVTIFNICILLAIIIVAWYTVNFIFYIVQKLLLENRND